MSHILFINHTRELHGSEQVLLQSLRVAHEAGHRVTLLVPGQIQDNGLDEAAQQYTDNILHLPYRPAGRHILRTLCVLVYNIYALLKTAGYVRKECVSCVYSNTSVTILGACVTALTKTPHLWHFHEPVSPMFGWHPSLKSLYRRALSCKNSHVLFISQTQRTEWERTLDMSIKGEVIYNPVRDINVKRQLHENVVVGYMGSFNVRKNISCLVKAFEEIHRKHPYTQLLLCGANNDTEISTVRRMTSLPAAAIDIRPFVKAEDFYSACDIFVLPSLSETMPLVSIEAMQAGVCVIQTCRSGMSELYRHGEDTLFFEPENIQQLVDLMEQCMNDDFRQRIARNGLARTKGLEFNNRFRHQLLSAMQTPADNG